MKLQQHQQPQDSNTEASSVAPSYPSLNVCVGLLLSARVRREGDSGDHHLDVPDLFHERRVRHAAALF